MNCEQASAELVECARLGTAVAAAVDQHLSTCDSCRERAEAERELSAHLRELRTNAPGMDRLAANAQWDKAVLLREFDKQRKHERQVRWMWAMSSAAVLVLSVVAMRDVWMKPSGGTPNVAAQSYPMREYSREAFEPAEEAGEKGFIKVPFALPPAPGETFGIVRTQLEPAELARMGVSVDPGWTGTLEADVLVGEDGFAQAVRLSNDTR